jgi:hypothetical protein
VEVPAGDGFLQIVLRCEYRVHRYGTALDSFMFVCETNLNRQLHSYEGAHVYRTDEQ